MAGAFEKTIVIPGEAFRHCLNHFAEDLWDDGPYQMLAQATKGYDPRQATTDDLYDRDRRTRRLLSRPFWKRRAIVAQWPIEAQIRLLSELHSRAASGQSHPLLRVSAVSLRPWLLGAVRPARLGPWHQFRVRPLAWTSQYAEWVRDGGDADVGRYLGIWAKKFYSIEP